MARTTQMRLVELMVLKQDIRKIIEFLGKKGIFQFETNTTESGEETKVDNTDLEIFRKLQAVRAYLNVPDHDENLLDSSLPADADYAAAGDLLSLVDDFQAHELKKTEEAKRLQNAYKEACAFSNLKASYSELEHLSFLSLRIGKIDPAIFDELKAGIGSKAVVVQLGTDKSRILAAASRKGRFALDTELKKYGFVNMEIPKDFKGIPEEVLQELKKQSESAGKIAAAAAVERKNFAETHQAVLLDLLGKFSIGMQVNQAECRLESTKLVYRITGWIPAYASRSMMKDLDQLSEGRIAIRQYLPSEVPAVVSGHEKVPVELKHGKIIGSFERMIFSYGSPLYGNVDPTPFVAVFFTILFGLMFGDAGQGLVFFLVGVLMALNVIKVKGWNKFAPVFMCIGVSSMIMGLLTGEFFANESILRPFERWVTGLFGTPRDQILAMMPQSNPESIRRMFLFFGFSLIIGLIINSTGIIINLINQFSKKKKGNALFGLTGLSGAIFFWYVIVMIIRIAAFHHKIAVYDWIILAVSLIATAAGEQLSRLVDRETPVFENGKGEAIMGIVVSALETVMTYMSNTVSFLRVGAFALAHAVLDYIILLMMNLAGGIGAVVIWLIGNLIVVVLEGMIVSIQAIRLQYYEFFSKFFNENGQEFEPFKFHYGDVA
jgi:V/A-type H+-transporting ATPase subunit I